MSLLTKDDFIDEKDFFNTSSDYHRIRFNPDISYIEGGTYYESIIDNGENDEDYFDKPIEITDIDNDPNYTKPPSPQPINPFTEDNIFEITYTGAADLNFNNDEFTGVAAVTLVVFDDCH